MTGHQLFRVSTCRSSCVGALFHCSALDALINPTPALSCCLVLHAPAMAQGYAVHAEVPPSPAGGTGSGGQQQQPPPRPNLLMRTLPPHLAPYAQLMRLDKPIGTWLLFLPCSW